MLFGKQKGVICSIIMALGRIQDFQKKFLKIYMKWSYLKLKREETILVRFAQIYVPLIWYGARILWFGSGVFLRYVCIFLLLFFFFLRDLYTLSFKKLSIKINKNSMVWIGISCSYKSSYSCLQYAVFIRKALIRIHIFYLFIFF